MKKGFTLAELLGVIVILGIIVLLAFPPILDSIKKSKENINNSTEEIIFNATKLYMGDYPSIYKLTNNSKYCIKIQDLIDSSRLERGLQDSNTNEEINPNRYVKVVVKNGEYTYSLVDTSC